MERAHGIDAVTKQKFWFRRYIVDKDSDYTENPAKEKKWKYSENDAEELHPVEDSDFVEMTIADILEGNPEIGNTGLYEIFNKYMDINNYDKEAKEFHQTMLDFLLKRAKGEIKTGARWMRDFVHNHPAYQKDSVVSPEIAYDLVKETAELGVPSKWDETLLGPKPDFMDQYMKKGVEL